MPTNRSFITALTTTMLAAGLLAAPQRPAPATPQKTAAPASDPRVDKLKAEAVADVDSMKDFSQQMVDQVFSFGELGYQEFETSTQRRRGPPGANNFQDVSRLQRPAAGGARH
jgi:hypothetical protein